MHHPPPAVRIDHLARTGGFTVVELIITLVVLGVLVALGVPAYTEFARNNRRAAVLNEFNASLNLARSEAIKRGLQVAMCKTADGTTCGGNGVRWEQGWLVFVNRDGDAPAVVDVGETVLRVHREANPAFRLTSNLTSNDDVGAQTNFVSYTPDGSSSAVGRLTYCDARGLRSARAVIINSTGRPRLSQDIDSDGIDEDESGNDLTCN